MKKPKTIWMPLDNAAKIYPASRNKNWSNMFRLSASLNHEIEIKTLKKALDKTIKRFPSIAVRLRRGLFWYYLQELDKPITIKEEALQPLVKMNKKETKKCALRIIVYKERLALEVFHSLTDGTGALVFLKTLISVYLEEKFGVLVSKQEGVLNVMDSPKDEELEDSFLKYSAKKAKREKENDAWHIKGTKYPFGFLKLTCFSLDAKEVLQKAHQNNVSVTVFLTAVIMKALQNLQKQKIKNINKRKPIRVLIPINLRKLFGSITLRNFALYTTPEIITSLGEYSFSEICEAIKGRMMLDNTKKVMCQKIAANVNNEKLMAVRLLPLFIKNFVMKIIFNLVGEKKSCLSFSNLGVIKLPKEMKPFINRFDFILGAMATAPYNVGAITYNDTLYLSFIRNIEEPDLEYHFYKVLEEFDIKAKVESNFKGE